MRAHLTGGGPRCGDEVAVPDGVTQFFCRKLRYAPWASRLPWGVGAEHIISDVYVYELVVDEAGEPVPYSLDAYEFALT